MTTKRNNGAPERIRTSDRLVRSQVLYPAELLAHTLILIVFVIFYCRQQMTTKRNNGAPERIRTSDRLVRSQVLYPAELLAHTKSFVSLLIHINNNK